MGNYKKAGIGLICLTLLSPGIEAQSLEDLFGDVIKRETSSTEPSDALNNRSPNLDSLTQLDADRGLREALTIGAKTVGARLNKENGYYGDPRIHIPLPGRLAELQNSLGRFGVSKTFDTLELQMNRAAESAAPVARDIVIRSINEITIEDAIKIVRGSDRAATDYIQSRATDELSEALRPYAKTALNEVGALNQLSTLESRYRLASMSGVSVEDKLIDHTVDYALKGLFHYLGEEEKAIRQNPVKRSSDILKRVFGS